MESYCLNGSTEIRKLPMQNVSVLGNILQKGHCWKDLMGLVPGKPWIPGERLPVGTKFPRKYTYEDISLVADECSRDGRTGFEVLQEEWGTSGKLRPKISDLIDLLDKAGLERGSLYLRNIINECDTEIQSGLIEEIQNIEVHDENISVATTDADNAEIICHLSDICIPRVPYKEIEAAIANGNNIGSGAFGIVYRGNIRLHNKLRTVAIKLLCDSDEFAHQLVKKETLFTNEIKTLVQCAHKNIIELEAYSYNNGEFALAYSFMENGSLFDRISCTNNTLSLPWKLRLKIAVGTAEGIVHLHTKFSPPLVHRDIKSPNILLDGNFTPKLGDFGIVRTGSRGVHNSTVVNTTAIGTQMYMAPEAFRGDVSVKMDTFSYGIVILELLTGLLYFDEERENRDLLSHVQEMDGEELTLLDASAGIWDTEIATQLFGFAELCTREKRDRPDMVQALLYLQNICKEVLLVDAL